MAQTMADPWSTCGKLVPMWPICGPYVRMPIKEIIEWFDEGCRSLWSQKGTNALCSGICECETWGVTRGIQESVGKKKRIGFREV